MKTVTLRQVQNNLNKVLAWVAEGQTVTITNRKESVARIVPVEAKSAAVEWPDFSSRLKRIYPKGVPCGKSTS